MMIRIMMIVITVDIMMIRWKDAAFTVHVGVSGRDSVVSHAIVMMVMVIFLNIFIKTTHKSH